MSNNKTIAKNTLFLYIRMFFSMGVTLYTSRVVLNALGVQDYGTYNVVGGIVTMLGFFNAAMTSATQRFLSFEIGNKNYIKLKQTFNATLNIHICISILILFLAETIGLWFINYELNLPLDRMGAVNWVYQFSILTFIVGVIQVPYNAILIARERMNVYAIFSIVEASLKLLFVYFLIISPFDKLKSYSFLMFLAVFLIANTYKIYCKKYFIESKYEFFYDKSLYLELLYYSGWNLFGNIAAVVRGQGTNILLNLFFGIILNAAYGITQQVQGAVSVFVTNFQMAVDPQIIKNYAIGNTEYCKKLIFQSSKFSYYLIFLIICPILFNIDFILRVWLENPPKYSSIFVSFSLVNLLIECLSNALKTGIQATGKIKWYQIIVGILVLLNLPISIICLNIYDDPMVIYYVSITIALTTLQFRLIFLKKYLDFSIIDFYKNVISRILAVTSISLLIILFIIDKIVLISNWHLFFVKIILILITLITCILLIGVNKEEKFFIYNFFTNKLLKKNEQ